MNASESSILKWFTRHSQRLGCDATEGYNRTHFLIRQPSKYLKIDNASSRLSHSFSSFLSCCLCVSVFYSRDRVCVACQHKCSGCATATALIEIQRPTLTPGFVVRHHIKWAHWGEIQEENFQKIIIPRGQKNKKKEEKKMCVERPLHMHNTRSGLLIFHI